MRIFRTAIALVALGGLVPLCGPLWAQPGTANLNYQSGDPQYSNASARFANDVPPSHRTILPLGPQDVEPYYQPFAPAETSGYGNGPRPKIGWWGSFERLYWSPTKPPRYDVGSPSAEGVGTSIFTGLPTNFVNSADNGFLTQVGAWGNRIEIGYIDSDAHGYLVSVLDHVRQGQFETKFDATLQFDDPGLLLEGFAQPAANQALVDVGRLVTQFTQLQMKNELTMNGFELMRLYRAPRLHNGGYFELIYGARWFQIDEGFIVSGFNDVNRVITGFNVINVIQAYNPLANSVWSTRVQNNLVGPQIGGRWTHQREHWIISGEARFLAAANFQNFHQITDLGSNAALNLAATAVTNARPLNFTGLGTNSHVYGTTFAPMGEIRAQAVYEVSRTVGIKVGYSGLYVGNVGRASNHIDYSVPTLVGLFQGAGHQSFFVNGLSFGVEVNR